MSKGWRVKAPSEIDLPMQVLEVFTDFAEAQQLAVDLSKDSNIFDTSVVLICDAVTDDILRIVHRGVVWVSWK